MGIRTILVLSDGRTRRWQRRDERWIWTRCHLLSVLTSLSCFTMIEQSQRALEMDPSFPLARWMLSQAYVAKGMYREALAEYEKYSAVSRGRPWPLALQGNTLAQMGERSEALRVVEELRAVSKKRFVPAVSFAVVYVGLGEKDQAFTWSEKAYEERSSSLAYLRVDSIWDSLHSDPRYVDLLRRMGLPQG